MTISPQFLDGTVPSGGDNQLTQRPLYRTDPRAVAYAVWRGLRDTASKEGQRYTLDNVQGWRWQGHLREVVKATYPDCADDPRALGTFQTTASAILKKNLKLIATIEPGGGGGALPTVWFVADVWPADQPKSDHDGGPEPHPQLTQALSPAQDNGDHADGEPAPHAEPEGGAPQPGPAPTPGPAAVEVAAPADKMATLMRLLGDFVGDATREATEKSRKTLQVVRGNLVNMRDLCDDTIGLVTGLIDDLEGAQGGDAA